MSYHSTRSKNGIRIASEKLTGPETVAFCVAYNTGARLEMDKTHGLAHLLEHMAFKGTAKRTAQQIAEAIDAIGGNMNAYTSMEQTVYYIHVLKEYLPVAVEMMADILQHASFDAGELEREKSVIAQEIAMHHDTPEDLIFDYLHEVAWPDHPLARNILGTEASVQALTEGDLHRYRNDYYHANSVVITAAGNVDHDALVKLVEAHFGDHAPKAMQSETAPLFKGGDRHEQRDMLEQTQLMLAYEGIASDHKDYYALQLFSTLFGGGLSSRLFQEIREKRGLVYTVQSFLTVYSDSGLLGIYAATSKDHLDELRSCLTTEIEKILQDGITDSEVERAKNQQIAAVRMRRENTVAVAEWMARHLHDYGEYRDTEALVERIQHTRREEIEQAARSIFSGSQPALATLGP